MPRDLGRTVVLVDSKPRGISVDRELAQKPNSMRRGAWRRRVPYLCGLIAACLLAALAWSELHPAALEEAKEAYRRNDLEAALRFSQSYITRRPFSRHANLLVARCLSRLGRPKDAEPYYQKASPLDLSDRHIQAYALVLNNMRKPAILAYHEILRLWPDDVLALSRLAAVQISESSWLDALETAGRLIRNPAGAVIGHTLAGVVHHKTGESEEAVVDFGLVLKLDPELKQMPLKPRSMFWADVGHSLLSIGRAQEAQRHLQRGLDESDDPKVADLLGQAYYLQGAFDNAEQCWRLALQWDPGRFGTWWRLGKLELQRGRAAEAIEPLLRSAALEPEAVGPLYSLSLAYRSLGRSEESERFMKQADGLRGRIVERTRRDVADPFLGTE
jgi:tetratricopeptide (TPR) repeat protein